MATGLTFKGRRPAGFSAAYGAHSTNFMTPDIHGYVALMVRGQQAIAELSSGYFCGHKIWGVSVAMRDAHTGQWTRAGHDINSGGFNSRHAAEEHILELATGGADDAVVVDEGEVQS